MVLALEVNLLLVLHHTCRCADWEAVVGQAHRSSYGKSEELSVWICCRVAAAVSAVAGHWWLAQTAVSIAIVGDGICRSFHLLWIREVDGYPNVCHIPQPHYHC